MKKIIFLVAIIIVQTKVFAQSKIGISFYTSAINLNILRRNDFNFTSQVGLGLNYEFKKHNINLNYMNWTKSPITLFSKFSRIGASYFTNCFTADTTIFKNCKNKIAIFANYKFIDVSYGYSIKKNKIEFIPNIGTTIGFGVNTFIDSILIINVPFFIHSEIFAHSNEVITYGFIVGAKLNYNVFKSIYLGLNYNFRGYPSINFYQNEYGISLLYKFKIKKNKLLLLKAKFS